MKNEHDLHRYADALRGLGVDPFWLLANAFAAEDQVQEWLRVNGWQKSDLPYHVHEVIPAKPSLIRAPSVQEAFCDLAGMREDGCAPDALDEVVAAMERRKPPGPKSSLSERKRDECDLEAFEWAKNELLSARRSPETAAPVLARHVREMRHRGLSLGRYALIRWAENTGRRSRDWTKLQGDLTGVRERVRKRKRQAEK